MIVRRGIKDLITGGGWKFFVEPWYIFFVVSVCICLYWAMEALTGRLSQSQHALGYIFAAIAILIAHCWRTAYKASEDGQDMLRGLISSLLGDKKDVPEQKPGK